VRRNATAVNTANAIEPTALIAAATCSPFVNASRAASISCAARLELRAELRHGQVQHGQVHRIQHAWQRDHGQADPLAPPCPGWALIE
jgi:hypothetical protein